MSSSTPPRVRRLLPALLFVLASAPPALGQIVVQTSDDEINTNGLCSLREAIINANNDDVSGSADCTSGALSSTITFDPSTDGVAIQLTLAGAGEDIASTGDLDIAGDLTITGNGAASARSSTATPPTGFSRSSAG